MARKGRGGNAQARYLRLHGIQASPLEVWLVSDRSDTSHVPHSGCSHGDRRNLHLCGRSRSCPISFPSCPEGQGGSVQGHFRRNSSFLVSILRRGWIPGKDPSGKVFFPIRVPSGGRKAKEGQKTFGALVSVIGPKTFPEARVDPRSHPFAMLFFPKEGHRGSWVEPWKIEFLPLSRPGGWEEERRSFFRGSDPLDGTCLPVCRGIGEPLLR